MSTTGSGGFEAITFNTGGINLTTGSQYILFATISNYYTPPNSAGIWGFIGDNTGYPPTYFAFYNNGGDFSALTTSDWDFPTIGGGYFIAEIKRWPLRPNSLRCPSPALSGSWGPACWAWQG